MTNIKIYRSIYFRIIKFLNNIITSNSNMCCTECYKCAEALIKKNRAKLKIIAEALLEYESLDGAQVEEIVMTGKFNRPGDGKNNKPGGATGAKAATPTSDVSKKKPPESETGLGAGSPAPAPA